jgi:hypothetical protein
MAAPGMPPAGLCGSCVHGERVPSSKGSAFLRCNRSFHDPRFPRYPTLPVVRCEGYEPPASATPDRGTERKE